MLVFVLAPTVFAQREQVLPQIDLPHNYYYREMYLPQLTTGPSSAAWTPDSKALVYSMGGSLWRQAIDATAAEQLTAGPGYDYQPDCSPDGKWILFARYEHDAIELYALEVASRKTIALTSGGTVNVEPRWSPDGNRIVWVSTSYNKRFHIFAAEWANGALANVERLTGEERSPLPRYYYSPYDTEISPAWSPDGSEIVFVSNRGHIYGSGGIWRMQATPGAAAREILWEETTWKARPDWSPDGKRILYASYAGRQWHQLWAMPAAGGSAIPLSYGEYDNVAARWSPNGKYIAFISNRTGNTTLWIQEFPGGFQRQIEAKQRKYLQPMGQVKIPVTDAAGRPAQARISVDGADGRAYAPAAARMHAEDAYIRSERPFEAHYFHADTATVDVPAGKAQILVARGFENKVERRTVDVAAGQTALVRIRLRPLTFPAEPGARWANGDLHVHMNYNGAYLETPKGLVGVADAEDVNVVHSLIVNKEQRIPDVAYFTGKLDAASTAERLLEFSQEYHTSDWGHLGLLALRRNFILPDYAAYPRTIAASLYPTNAVIADLAHAQGGLVGYVHPFEDVPDPAKDERLINELPIDVALGKVDYIEVVGFSDHRSTATVWYQLLNCGFRMPTGAGTDATPNFASTLHGVVGTNRVYVRMPAGPLKMETFLDGLKRGRTFATNGPLLRFTLGGKEIGDEIQLPEGLHEMKFTAALRSIVPIDHLEVVCNGEVEKSLPLSGDRTSADATGSVTLDKSGWCVLRAWSEKGEHPVLDIYPYATTSPIYVTLGETPPRSAESAAYFLAWLERIRQAVEAHQDWNTDEERAEVMKSIAVARKVFQTRE